MDLKSQTRTGEKFVAQKQKERPYGREVRTAIIKEYFTNEKRQFYIADSAYFCNMGCNWVLGVPETGNYDDIGFLSGSAGVNFYCKICGMHIGQKIYKRS
jgi:hypothetical protein